MKAFTQLCHNINISLFHNTLTIYPKAGNLWDLRTALHATKPKRFVHRTDSDHNQFHQDYFNRETVHFHAQYFNPINLGKFNQILSELQNSAFISKQEHNHCFNTYQQVNSENAFIDRLLVLHAKASAFEYKAQENAGLIPAAKTARTLHSVLSNALTRYQKHQTTATYHLFIESCEKAIATARPELEKHRDNNYLLANLLLAALTLGVGYFIAGIGNLAINGDFLFFRQTDSIKKINQLEKTLNKIHAPIEPIDLSLQG